MITIISVNVADREILEVEGRRIPTGICKYPLDHAVAVNSHGIVGDVICNTKHHGGLDQALYLYRTEDYQWWHDSLGELLQPGSFGENLMISGIASASLKVGTLCIFPNLIIEITAPRIPCATLAKRVGRADFVKTFIEAERPGFYCRVIQSGTVQVGQVGEVKPPDYPSITTVQFYRDLRRKLTPAELSRYLAIPIDERSRQMFEAALAKQRSD